MTALVPLTDQNGVTFACDEHILALLDRAVNLGEDGDVAAVGQLAYPE